MQKPKFNWEDARYFLAVARVGTVGKAAVHRHQSSRLW